MNAVIVEVIRHRGAAAVGAFDARGDNVVSGSLKRMDAAATAAFCHGARENAQSGSVSARGGIHRRVLRGVFGDVARGDGDQRREAPPPSPPSVVSTNPLAWVTGVGGHGGRYPLRRRQCPRPG